ncbi:V [Skunk adenovirus 1]|uniref:V n=1 Tax=Skunk adenovirus 1 TaxID=2698728 RepID=A0A0K0MGD0_9ADEN|nr:V [Skunk adenovirus PB1] [Skunk adenovirus PB1]QKF54469.1 pV [Skunk adenovirus HUN/2009]UKT59819.1 V [Raccoon adenovirus] [Raccoon adenovirus]UKT59849.1 V [Porcupine adenovirus] [Porcupine adenovirus]UWY10648.1 pV [Skunk adenovirus 1]AKC34848.1 V [Skunk adenovirus PB1] [Skunk adenovirus PB1]
MAAISRALKQEILDDLLPEVYVPTKSRRRPKIKTEGHIDVKTLVKAKTKKRRVAKQDLDEEVEFVRTFAPRRPYQWKGRKVRAVLRPGVPVVFTPGQRSGTATKRDFDEVYADEDILAQEAVMINEFAYGKRPRVTLTRHNPTPSQVPITKQEPVVKEEVVAPGEAKLLPTVQVLVSKNMKNEPILPISKKEAGDVKIENHGVEQVAPGLGVQTVDIKVPIKRKRAAETEIEIKKIKEELEPMQTTLNLQYAEQPEVMTFDSGVEPLPLFESAPTGRPIAVARKRRVPTPAPAQVEVMETQQTVPTAVVSQVPSVSGPPVRLLKGRTYSRYGPANAIPPDYRYHPSITANRLRAAMPTGRVSRWGPANSILPTVQLHPSMVGPFPPPRGRRVRRRRRRTKTRPSFIMPARTRRGVMLPENVRYHPSISVLTRRS